MSKVKGIEVKHITHVVAKDRKNDLHVVKEVVHYEDGTKEPRLKFIENYKRPFWVTQKGRQNHKDKKDFEYARNLDKYMCTQAELNEQIQLKINGFVKQGWVNPRVTAQSPFLYGADVGSVSCLKYEYRQAYPDLITPNTVAGGDIETNVYEDENDGQIICMSVTFKDKAYIAYLKRWVSDIKDPIQATKDEIESLPEVKALFEGRNIKLEIEIVETPANIVINCIKRLHDWKPDFFSFWNIDFDMTRILDCLEYHGIDPADVFSDPSVPKQYKYFRYKRDGGGNISASGVNKTKDPADQWHWVFTPASFQPVDAMSTYRLTRLAAGKAASYSLDYILEKELAEDHSYDVKDRNTIDSLNKDLERFTSKRPGSYPYFYVSNPSEDIIETVEVGIDETTGTILTDEISEPVWKEVNSLEYNENYFDGYRIRFVLDYGKLKFPEVDRLTGIEWHREMQTKHKIKYGVYNLVDSIRLEQLDEHIDDLASNITLYSKYSDYQNFNSNPKKLCDDMHFWFLERPDPCVMATSSNEMVTPIDKHVVTANNWIVTLPSFMMSPSGLNLVKEFPNYNTYVYAHIADLDK